MSVKPLLPPGYIVHITEATLLNKLQTGSVWHTPNCLQLAGFRHCQYVLPQCNFNVLSIHLSICVFLQSPAIAEDSYILVVLFIYLFIFFRPPNFRRPWADFRETLPHDAVCAVNLWLCEHVHTKHGGGPPPISEIGCPLGVGWSR